MQLTGIAHQIWDDKYRYKNNHGEPIDATIEETFMRVAKAIALAEKTPQLVERYTEVFYDAMRDFCVIPAGRILAGAGTGRNVTLQNCYVMGQIPDSMRGIYDALTESALTMQQGGGIGNDFSTLRPSGALIESLGSTASGPLPFMDSWNAMCGTIMSAGTRRGAMMGTLRIDHPDIEAFIEAKSKGDRFKMFNLSVLVTDDFMQAVKDNAGWPLVFGGKTYKVVPAWQLWDKIMRMTYDCADPGVIFIDRVNKLNPLNYAETLSCTNPCGEKPLPPYGSCCLGSINLTRMVIDPFTPDARIDHPELHGAVATLTRMLDNVLDVTNYPLPQQHEEAMRKRRIGIGITGLADMLVMLGIEYGSDKAVQLARGITADVYMIADETTQQLGAEKGSFPLYDPDCYRNQRYGAKYRRNSHLASIAPTGTISLLAGNISSGIEPIFDLTLRRRVLQRDNTWKEVEIQDYAYSLWCNKNGPLLRAPWVTAADLKPIDHLKMLAACQENVDSSISKTINCPEAITFDEFKDIYLEAYRLGVKSCTTYRPNKITGSILSSSTMTTETPKTGTVVELTKPLVRPEALQGATYRLKPPNLQHALFITINDIVIEGKRRPFEIFINTKNLEFLAWSTALTRMISAIFRRGGDIAFITDELAAVFDPHGGGYWEDKHYVPSLIAGIGNVIKQHLATVGIEAVLPAQPSMACPKCRAMMVSKEGCWSCTSCTYSACG